jgi:hypothetical protein
MLRRAAKKDFNHAEIAQAFEKLGCDVLDLSRVGGGCPDLLIRVRAIDLWRLVEIKTEKGRLKPAQKEFASRWPVFVVRTLDDVLEVIRAD